MNDCWSHVMRTVRMVLSVQSITRDLEFVYSPHQRPAGFLTYRSSIQNTFPVSQWPQNTSSRNTVTSSYRILTCFPFHPDMDKALSGHLTAHILLNKVYHTFSSGSISFSPAPLPKALWGGAVHPSFPESPSFPPAAVPPPLPSAQIPVSAIP